MNELVIWSSGLIGGVAVAALAGIVYLANCAVIVVAELASYAEEGLAGLAVATSRLFGY